MSIVQAAFEFWFRNKNNPINEDWRFMDDEGEYSNLVIQGEWEVWQDAWVYALRSNATSVVELEEV